MLFINWWMFKKNINLIKSFFNKKYIDSNLIIFINKKQKIILFFNNKHIFINLINKLISNIIKKILNISIFFKQKITKLIYL